MAAVQLRLRTFFAATTASAVMPCRSRHDSTRRRPQEVLKLKRARNLGLGVYAGQRTNFDENHVDFFPITVPDIPLTPEGTDYKPSKLLMVWRIKTTKGRPYWEKNIIESLELDGPKFDIQVVKNSPTSNRMLWHVKHLIRIKPITFPDGIPTEADIGNTVLQPDGRLLIKKELKVDAQQLSEPPPVDVKRLDGETLRKHLRQRWIDAYDI